LPPGWQSAKRNRDACAKWRWSLPFQRLCLESWFIEVENDDVAVAADRSHHKVIHVRTSGVGTLLQFFSGEVNETAPSKTPATG
jgi:hypothetical protein